MPDETNLTGPDSTDPKYPPTNLPSFFADGILNFTNSTENVKFYFYRYDPSLNAIGPANITPVCQTVMPLTAFVGTVAFLQAAINTLVKQGVVSADEWKKAQDEQIGFK